MPSGGTGECGARPGCNDLDVRDPTDDLEFHLSASVQRPDTSDVTAVTNLTERFSGQGQRRRHPYRERRKDEVDPSVDDLIAPWAIRCDRSRGPAVHAWSVSTRTRVVPTPARRTRVRRHARSDRYSKSTTTGATLCRFRSILQGAVESNHAACAASYPLIARPTTRGMGF
jgi:hypothetical protein